MSVHLPKPIERFLSSENASEAEVLAACFARDGIVRDEGRTREGLEDIVAWRRETVEKYQHTFGGAGRKNDCRDESFWKFSRQPDHARLCLPS